MPIGPGGASGGPGIIDARTRTPRILYVTPHWPHRATGASELRAFHIADALRAVGDVEVIVIDGEGRPEQGHRRAHNLTVAYSVPVVPHPNDGLRSKLQWMLDPRRSFPHGCGVDDAAAQRIARTAGEFDLTWFSKLRTANMLPQWSWPSSVVDIDDVPSTYEKSLLSTELSPAGRAVTYARYLSWKRREQLLGQRFSVLAVCSEADKRYLRGLGVSVPTHVIPNGADRPATVPVRRRVTPPRIGFIGIFDYLPNASGVAWFVRECWPAILRAVPDARLRLVGRDSDGPLKPEAPGVDGLGWVDHVNDEVSTWSAMIVPIRIGAGTRGKIAQAFGLKVPVVSTTLGAHGYDPVDGDVMYVADSPDAFVRACVRTIREADAAQAMAERAWHAFLERWTWEAIAPRIRAAAVEGLQIGARRVAGSSGARASTEKSLTPT
jgi:glycosyltransferase involved in cell wall biosynthesis